MKFLWQIGLLVILSAGCTTGTTQTVKSQSSWDYPMRGVAHDADQAEPKETSQEEEGSHKTQSESN